ncbi:hypothetical protein GCM10022222_85120 [Amycolatopsis ultiminotia]|uniref:Uncharacterized protein n=1 Tax=Amycolatopsis ultiminotia TaxID=543629 RepID=A0ABP6YNP1_9PSEU
MGEVVLRVTGLTVGKFVVRHVAGPLGADFHIGLGSAELACVADIVPPPPHAGTHLRWIRATYGEDAFMSTRFNAAPEVNTMAWR